MMTILVAYILISLTSGLPIKQFATIDECIVASYHVSFVTGQETRCEAVRRVAR